MTIGLALCAALLAGSIALAAVARRQERDRRDRDLRRARDARRERDRAPRSVPR